MNRDIDWDQVPDEELEETVWERIEGRFLVLNLLPHLIISRIIACEFLCYISRAQRNVSWENGERRQGNCGLDQVDSPDRFLAGTVNFH